MAPVRLLKIFSNLYAYSFRKVCHPVRLFKNVRLLETLEYMPSAFIYFQNFYFKETD